METTVMNEVVFYKETLDPVNRIVYDIFASFYPRTEVFVETGCNEGNSLVKAINMGFREIYSCDIVKLFCDRGNALLSGGGAKGRVVYSSSVEFLKEILPTVSKPILFWLDAHDSRNNGTWGELEIIKQSFISDSVIIIDDIPIYFSGREKELENKLLEINPDFKLEYMTTREKDYILVAS